MLLMLGGLDRRAWRIAHRPMVSNHRSAINFWSIIDGLAENGLTIITLDYHRSGLSDSHANILHCMIKD